LLCGACHRARIRATRWLAAMTIDDTASRSRDRRLRRDGSQRYELPQTRKNTFVRVVEPAKPELPENCGGQQR
jgi:hypothetical protein